MRRKMFALILLAALLLSLGTACGKGTNVEKKLEGSWYRDGHTSLNRDMRDGPEYIFYSDGTCQIASEYGECKWTIVNDGQLKLTNFYGEVNTVEIGELTDEKLTLYFGQFSVDYFRSCTETEISANITSGDGYTPVENVEDFGTNYSKPYHQDAVMIKYIDPSGSKATGFMNTVGKIISIPEFPNISWAGMIGSGKYLVRYEENSKQQFSIVDIHGNIILRSPEDANYSVHSYDNESLVVERFVNDEDENMSSYGIMRRDGSWLIEPFGHNMLGLSADAQALCNNMQSQFFYCEDKIFAEIYYSNGKNDFGDAEFVTFYNAETGARAEFENMQICAEEGNTYFHYTKFQDGKALITSDDTIYSIKTDFSLEPVMSIDPGKYVLIWDGVILTGDKQTPQNDNSERFFIDNVKLYNSEGELILDLSQYTFLKIPNLSYFFSVGFIPALVYEEDNGYFAGWIGLDGKFTFEPVKVPDESVMFGDIRFSAADRIISIRTEESVDGEPRSKFTIIMCDGRKNEFYTDRDIYTLEYSCGAARVTHLNDTEGDRNGVIYYDGYIDIYGKKIVPMLKTG